MRNRISNRSYPRLALRSLGLSLVALALTGCNPLYVIRAAYEQTKILASREDISDVVANPSVARGERQKLHLVSEARTYGISLGLEPKDSFTQFARVEGPAVAWVLSASPKDRFELYTWWFPFVGSIPYKGYFDKSDAIDAAQDLAAEGYETWVRGTEAFSTLGWFSDPVLSTTLAHEPAHIVNTVLHESLHTTLWVQDHVAFNESLANFVGAQGCIDFFRTLQRTCATSAPELSSAPLPSDGSNDTHTDEAAPDSVAPSAPTESAADSFTREACLAAATHLRDAEHAYARELALSRTVTALMTELRPLYESDKSFDEKMLTRQAIFESHIGPLRAEYPELKILTEINNAELLQLELYLKQLDRFAQRFLSTQSDWPQFLAEMQTIAQKVDEQRSLDPFSLL